VPAELLEAVSQSVSGLSEWQWGQRRFVIRVRGVSRESGDAHHPVVSA